MKSSNLFGGFIFYCYLCIRNNNRYETIIANNIFDTHQLWTCGIHNLGLEHNNLGIL